MKRFVTNWDIGLIIRYTILVAVACFFFSTMRDGHSWGGDFAQYIAHAKNLSIGVPYEDTGYIYNPANPVIGPRAYPPIFPLSLSLTYKIFGLDLDVFKIQIVLIFLVSLVVTAKLFSRFLDDSSVAVYLIVTGFTPVFWQFKDQISSEFLFLLFWYITFYIADLWYRHRIVIYSDFVHAILLGVFVYLSYGTRTVGIVLLPSIIVCEILVTGPPTRFGILAVMVAIGLILLEKLLLPTSGAGYVEQLNSINLQSVLSNLHADTVAFSAIWENGFSDRVRQIAFIIFSVFALIGFWRDNSPQPSFLGISMVLYLVVVVLWPSSSWVRMIIPLIPGYVFYVLLGMYALNFSWIAKRWVLAFFCLFSVISYVSWYSSRADYGPIKGVETPSVVELFQFVRENALENEKCLFFKPRVLSLYTNCQAMAYSEGLAAAEKWERAKSAGASLVIIRSNNMTNGKWDRVHNGELNMVNQSSELVEIWHNKDFRVFRLSSALN